MSLIYPARNTGNTEYYSWSTLIRIEMCNAVFLLRIFMMSPFSIFKCLSLAIFCLNLEMLSVCWSATPGSDFLSSSFS